MSRVRPFEKADIPQVVALHPRAFEDSNRPPPDYFEEFFFKAPFADPDIRPLVYEAKGGGIAGFLGVMPRRYTLRGRPVRVAVAAQFMLDPGARSATAGLSLFKAFLAGPQDLSLADATNGPGRAVWQAFKARTVWPYGIHWSRALRPRPSGRVRASLSGSPALRLAKAAVWPFLPVLDRAVAEVWRRRHPLSETGASHGPISVPEMVEGMREIAGDRLLSPNYDRDSLDWLLRRAAAKTMHGELRGVGVWDKERRLLGWFVYYRQPRGHAQVLQLVARPNAVSDVLESLLADAMSGGADSVGGYLDPSIVQALSARTDISYHLSQYWMMVHARDPDLLAAIHGGDALLSRLDGEWSMAFHGEAIA